MYAEENDFPTVHKIEIMKVYNRITCSKLLMTPCRKIQLLHCTDDRQPQKCSYSKMFFVFIDLPHCYNYACSLCQSSHISSV